MDQNSSLNSSLSSEKRWDTTDIISKIIYGLKVVSRCNFIRNLMAKKVGLVRGKTDMGNEPGVLVSRWGLRRSVFHQGKLSYILQ